MTEEEYEDRMTDISAAIDGLTTLEAVMMLSAQIMIKSDNQIINSAAGGIIGYALNIYHATPLKFEDREAGQ